jgi:hypothetical protein
VEELALLSRLEIGFYSLLSKLDVELDYAALQRENFAENPTNAETSTPTVAR